MLRRAWMLVILLLAVPSAAAAVTGDLAGDAPFELLGNVRAGGPLLTLYHLAPAQGSLEGIAYEARLYDHQTWRDCDYDWVRAEEVVLQARGNDSASILSFYGAKDTVFRYAFRNPNEVRVSSESLASSDSTEATLLGPNPYPLVVEPDSGEASALRPILPPEEFLLVPPGELSVTTPGELFVESGELIVLQRDQSRSFRTETTEKTIRCTGTGGPLFPEDRPTQVVHTYSLIVDHGFFSADQAGLDRVRAWWDGKPASDPFEGQSAFTPFSWSNQGAKIADAYESLLLPHTMVVSEELVVPLGGVLKVKEPSGRLSDNGSLQEIRGAGATLSGNLEVQPNSTTPDGQRMGVQLSGDIVVTPDVPTTPTPWDRIAAGAGAAALALGLFAFYWPAFKFRTAQLLIVPLYARLRKDEVLENELRDDILVAVQQEPGISASELGRRVVCGWGTLVYHLTVLERMRLVSSTREGRHRRYFAQGRINYSDKGAVALLANPAARTILDAIRDSPGLIQKDLSARLGLSPGTVAWHVERLVSQGLIVKEDEGRTVRYFPSDRLLDLTRQLAA